MTQRASGALRVYADYVCPFCFLGYASLEQFLADREDRLETEWHPFDLRSSKRRPDGTIDLGVDDGKDDEYFAEAQKNVERLAEQYDVELAQTLRRDVDSFDAQRVALRVREHHPESFDAFHRAVFDALWLEGEDIGERAVLEACADDAGLPTSIVTAALADDTAAVALEDAFSRAQREGVTGVPTFVYAGYAARGAVPPEHLEQLVDGA